MRAIHLVTAFATGALLTGTAQASEAELRALIDDMLSGAWGDSLVVGAEPQITPAGNGHEVVFPDLAVRVGEDDDLRLVLSPLTLQAEPADPGHYAMVFQLPDRMPLIDGSDEEAVLTVGSHRIEGLFHGELGAFTRFDANLADLLLEPGDDAPDEMSGPGNSVTLSAVNAVIDLDIDDDGLISGNSRLTARDGAITLDGEQTGQIERLGLDATVDRMSPANYRALISDPERVTGSLDARDWVEATDQAFGGATWAATVTGLDMLEPERGERIRIDEANATVSMAEVDQVQGHIDIDYRHSGLTASGFGELDQAAPGALTLAMTLADFPGLPVWARNADRLDGSPDAMTGLFADAGTRITLDGASDADIGGFALAGDLTATAATIFGAIGHVTLDIRNLSRVGQALQQVPDESAMMAFMIAQGLARPHPEDSATSRYHLEMTEDGRVTMNGLPLDQILGGMP